jgi:hypothetical protein
MFRRQKFFWEMRLKCNIANELNDLERAQNTDDTGFSDRPAIGPLVGTQR